AVVCSEGAVRQPMAPAKRARLEKMRRTSMGESNIERNGEGVERGAARSPTGQQATGTTCWRQRRARLLGRSSDEGPGARPERRKVQSLGVHPDSEYEVGWSWSLVGCVGVTGESPIRSVAARKRVPAAEGP